MQVLQFISEDNQKILFDDFTDERDTDYCGIWVGVCSCCANKYADALKGHLDDYGSGCCSVLGCENEADYYVDFLADENVKIIEMEG